MQDLHCRFLHAISKNYSTVLHNTTLESRVPNTELLGTIFATNITKNLVNVTVFSFFLFKNRTLFPLKICSLKN